MIPITQTKFGDPEGPAEDVGNCWAACIASTLEIPLEDVPDGLRTETKEEAWDTYQRFLATFNLRAVSLDATEQTPEWIDHWINSFGDTILQIIGDSPRGPWAHGVIYQKGRLLHDPHPDRTDVKKITYVEFWVVIDPSKPSGRRARLK